VKILTTGVKSGLGRFLHEQLGGLGLSRNSDIFEEECLEPIDVIIHCAFNPRRILNSQSQYSFLQDNIFLTHRLTCLPHKKFIYISSVDVYPKNGKECTEDDYINIETVDSLYGIFKLFSESIIISNCGNFLIIRPGLLLGKYMRKNNLLRLITEENCALSLTGESTFNGVLYSDVLSFIEIAMHNHLTGIYNAVSNDIITLGKLAAEFGENVSFGNFTYTTPPISNKKITGVCKSFSKSTLDTIKEFLKEL
jgi:nucleoside-diphosphate-sugar epimerase